MLQEEKVEEKNKQFLEDLLAAPGPSGYEGPVRAVWKKEVETYADAVEVDVHGNVIAALNAQAQPRVMLAGHIDELGFQIIYIDDKGYIYFDTIGGFDMGLVPGTVITIQGRAPLNDPVALRLMGFTLTLRNSEADYIQVEVDQ